MDSKDQWSLPWAGKYSCKKVYEELDDSEIPPKTFQWIWKSRAPPKQRFFFWWILLDRLNTMDLLPRKNFYVESKSCVLCQDCTNETMEHLFFSCDFSQTFWWKLNLEWNSYLQGLDRLVDVKQTNNFICYKEVVIAGCWSVWNHRNKIIFDNQNLDILVCFWVFKQSFALVMHRA